MGCPNQHSWINFMLFDVSEVEYSSKKASLVNTFWFPCQYIQLARAHIRVRRTWPHFGHEFVRIRCNPLCMKLQVILNIELRFEMEKGTRSCFGGGHQIFLVGFCNLDPLYIVKWRSIINFNSTGRPEFKDSFLTAESSSINNDGNWKDPISSL